MWYKDTKIIVVIVSINAVIKEKYLLVGMYFLRRTDFSLVCLHSEIILKLFLGAAVLVRQVFYDDPMLKQSDSVADVNGML